MDSKEHLARYLALSEKRRQEAEDHRRREQDVHFRRIEIGIMAYVAIISTISIVLSLIMLLR